MSRDNVELAKRVTEAINGRDWDGLSDLVTVDFEWFPALPGAVEGEGYRGWEEFTAYVRKAEETWEYLRAIADEYRDLGDSVLMLGRMEARGRASGVRVETQLAEIMDFRDGRLVRDRVFLDHDEALRAAGLAE